MGRSESPKRKHRGFADAILDTLAGPSQRFSRVSVANRGILFDYERTIGAFQRKGGPPAAPADLRLRTSVNPGEKSVLDDCSQLAFKLCVGLGWSVYVWLDPVLVADSAITIRAIFVWADRGNTQFSAGVAPQSRALLVGFAREVHLAHGANGVWRVTRLGVALVGE